MIITDEYVKISNAIVICLKAFFSKFAWKARELKSFPFSRTRKGHLLAGYEERLIVDLANMNCYKISRNFLHCDWLYWLNCTRFDASP
jgi:hypothetical protein